MMKHFNIIVLAFVALLAASCNKKVSFGTVEYYPSFPLWDEKVTPVTKTFDLDWSQDALDEDGVYAEFQFVDDNHRPISTNVMQASIDGKPLPDNKFKVDNRQKSVDITFTFSKSAEKKSYQGKLLLVSHRLERINSTELSDGSTVEAFPWKLEFEQVMNPLKKMLLWIISVIGGIILAWKLFVCRMFYPRFGSIQKTFIVPGMAPIIVNFKDARMVVIAASHPKKQNGWNSFWKGDIKYITHPAFVSPITFKPSRGHKILAKAQANIYQIMPNPMPGIGAATINIISSKLKVTVN